VGPAFDFKDGLFSGYNPDNRSYDKSKWAFEMDADGVPRMDRTLKHERTVFQLLKKHFARYNPELVSEIAGTSEKELLDI
jgi:formate dehydrogenase major subunit